MPHYIISVSYGNDSVAMIQWAHEAGLDLLGDVSVVFCDTGWATEEWMMQRVPQCEDFARRLGFRTYRTSSIGMAELVRIKKGWPGNAQQFCTGHLKGIPFLEWCDEYDGNGSGIVMIGKRRVESVKRRETQEFVADSEYHGGRTLWHALYLHTDEQRDALLRRAGFNPLPHRSQECTPCVNANRGDILDMGPDDMAKVNRLEVEIGKPMFRPKRFNGLGIYGVVMWARFGKNHEADVPDDEGCGSPFGCEVSRRKS